MHNTSTMSRTLKRLTDNVQHMASLTVKFTNDLYQSHRVHAFSTLCISLACFLFAYYIPYFNDECLTCTCNCNAQEDHRFETTTNSEKCKYRIEDKKWVKNCK